MPRHIAFLRAINVGGNTVKMEALRACFEALGLASVETFIASGNVIFDAGRGGAAALERKIESALEAELGFRADCFLRTPSEVAAIAACPPVPAEIRATAAACNVGFLKAPLGAADLATLKSLESALDAFFVAGREVYWTCRVKQSESKFNGGVFERKIGQRVTFRGVNTVERLAAKYTD